MTKLKPCPFCGKEPENYITVCNGKASDYIVAKIRCTNCEIEIKDHVNNYSSFDEIARLEDKVISKWNSRFTGVIDKTGKKIYDGDVVRITTDCIDTYRCMYDYQNAVYVFNPTIADISDSAEETLRELRGIPYCENRNLEIEVIDNG